MRAGGEPLRHERGAPPARIAQDPADGLADEELLLLQHAVRVPAEPVEVAVPAAQRAEQGKHRGPAEPEVVVRGPAVQGVEKLRVALGQLAHDAAGQVVHQRPGTGRAQHGLHQQRVLGAEQADVGVQKLHSGHPAVVHQPGPQRADDGHQAGAGEARPARAPRPDRRAHHRHRRAGELQVALEVGLLADRPIRSAGRPQRVLDRGGLAGGVCVHCGSGHRPRFFHAGWPAKSPDGSGPARCANQAGPDPKQEGIGITADNTAGTRLAWQ